MTGVRIDPGPLLDWLATDGDRSAAQVGRRLGVTTRTVFRWRGGASRLTLYAADRHAAAAGEHPASIWPDWYEVTG